MAKQQAARRLGGTLLATFALPIFVWFVWYRLAGYNPWTLAVVQGLVLVEAARQEKTGDRETEGWREGGSN